MLPSYGDNLKRHSMREGEGQSMTAAFQDSYWQVPATEYVPAGVAPASRLFDDAEATNSAWRVTVATLRDEATDFANDQAVAKARQINEAIEDERRQPEGADRPELTITADKPAAAPRTSRFFRLGTILRLLRT